MNTRFVETFRNRRVTGRARVRWLALAIFLGLLISCGPTATAVNVVGSGYDVREDKNAAWASINVLNPLDALALNTWNGLVPNGMVTTDTTGIAELRNTSSGCSNLYVFRDSGVRLGPCTSGASGSWNCVIGAATSASCDVGLASPSANVILRGTWVSLITVDNGALSIVTVLKGAADVVPVTQLEYRYGQLDDHSFVLTFNTRVLDETQTIRLGPGESTYTASDDYLASLPPNLTLPARTRLDQVQFQSLIRQLLPRFPLLQGYLEDVSIRATIDGQIFPAVLGNTILLQGQGGFLVDKLQQQVVLLGVDWNAVQKVVAGAQPASLAFQLPGREGLLTDPANAYDPNTANKISDEYKIGRNPITLLVPPGDDRLRTVANSMMEAFKAMNIPLNLKVVTPGELQPTINTSVEAGMPVLWLEWR
jgi:hypothetical protein